MSTTFGVNHISLEVQLSVIIVNWNTRELLAQCLQSLCSASYVIPTGCISNGMPPLLMIGPYTAEVLVVDNASSDGSAQMVRERFPWVRLIENKENVGFARANNQAIRHAQGRYVLLLNSDTEVRPTALETLVVFADTHPQTGAVGPRLLNTDGSLQSSCHPMLTPEREFWRLIFLDSLWPKATYPMHRWHKTIPRQVEVIKGACLLLRRKALDQVGILDESYFMYTEEVDLCYRLARKGWQCWWVPEAQVVHHGEASSRQVALVMYIQLYRSKIQFYRKFGGTQRANRFKALVRLAYWPRLMIATVSAPFLPFMKDRAHTYRCLLAELRNM